jgi:hypothetical protein
MSERLERLDKKIDKKNDKIDNLEIELQQL